MSYWLTKGTTDDRDYIIIRHTIPGVNYVINGVKFRGGFAVVEKNSKLYFSLKKLPALKNSKELPLLFLKKLPFITKPYDVFTIYGKDVYNKYITLLDEDVNKELQIQKEEAVEQHIASGGCKFIKENGEICSFEAHKYSPSQYCKIHMYSDPEIDKLNIHKSRFMDKDEKKAWKDKVFKELEKLYNEKNSQ